MIAEQRSSIGRFCIVVFQGKCYIATVMDVIAGSNTPKRVRIQRDLVHQGKVLQPLQYAFKEWADEEND